MKIGILGAGAMGCLFGGYLKRDGHDVSLIDIWQEHVACINDEGLRIERATEPLTVHPTALTDPSELDPVDLIFVFVKSQDTADAIESVAQVVTESTIVVTVQNGLTNVETIDDALPNGHVVGGYTTSGASVLEPGVIFEDSRGLTKIGDFRGSGAATVAETLSDAGLDTIVVSDPRSHMWDKQFVSVGVKPIAAITGLRYDQILESTPTKRAIRALVDEAEAVAIAMGITIMSDDIMADIVRILEENGTGKSSMLVDIEHERRTEIDHINGAIVAYGADYGIPVPKNELVTDLISGIEDGFDMKG